MVRNIDQCVILIKINFINIYKNNIMFEAILYILFVGGLITGTQILGGYIIASIIINKKQQTKGKQC